MKVKFEIGPFPLPFLKMRWEEELCDCDINVSITLSMDIDCTEIPSDIEEKVRKLVEEEFKQKDVNIKRLNYAVTRKV